MAATYPSVFPADYNKLRWIKIGDFGKHLHHQQVITDRIILTTGYVIKSGWYLENEYALLKQTARSNVLLRQLN